MGKGINTKWTKEEEDYLITVISQAYGNGTQVNYSETIEALAEIRGVVRPDGSLRNKLGRLRAIHGFRYRHYEDETNFDPNRYEVHSTLTLLEQSFNKGAYAKYELICDNGHVIYVEPCHWENSCGVCAHKFTGGIPKNDYRPAVVYLIYIKELKSIKIGYATGKGQDAINTRFQKWKIPYDYEILAYDQSTRTEAAEHEQWLLENTIKHKTFETTPGFTGWTEFRNIEVLHEVLPEYETVLDMAYKI